MLEDKGQIKLNNIEPSRSAKEGKFSQFIEN
jgi:hypothetical protein